MQWSLQSTRFSRSSVSVTLGGIYCLGSGVVEWTEKIGGDPVFMNAPIAIGKVIGEVSSDISIPMIVEQLDNVKQAIGTGYAERPLPLCISLFEPGNPSGIYTISNDTCYLAEDAFSGAAEGAVSKLKLIGMDVTNWNGVTAIDLQARNLQPGLLGALFAAVGLAL